MTDSATPVTQAAPSRNANATLLGTLSRYAPAICLVILMIVFALLEPAFLTPLNLFNVMRQISIEGLIAIGMTFVILTAGIDLSVGSLLACAGLVAAMIAKGSTASSFSLSGEAVQGYGWFAAMMAAMLVGLGGGALHGLAITKLKVPPFVVTLGGLSAWRGAALMISSSGPISGFDADYRWWGQGRLWQVPIPVIIFLSFAILAHIVLRYTRYGRTVYAVGGNREAARLSGVNVQRVLMSVYIIVGFFAGLAGFVLSARLNSSEAVAGIGYELTVIASVVIGGTSLFGGSGTVGGTVIGMFIPTALNNGFIIVNVEPFWQELATGFILIAAVYVDQIKRRARDRA